MVIVPSFSPFFSEITHHAFKLKSFSVSKKIKCNQFSSVTELVCFSLLFCLGKRMTLMMLLAEVPSVALDFIKL
jgi:hypothetical protein